MSYKRDFRREWIELQSKCWEGLRRSYKGDVGGDGWSYKEDVEGDGWRYKGDVWRVGLSNKGDVLRVGLSFKEDVRKGMGMDGDTKEMFRRLD